MRERILIAIILCGTFFSFFLLTTIVCDRMDKQMGYYTQGQLEAASVGQE